MRILLLNYEFPPVGAGAANASAQIARHLARRGVDVAVLTSHYRGLQRREDRDGYRIYRVPTLRQRPDRCTVPEMGAFVLSALLPALRLASSFRPDLMHVFFGMPTGPVGLLVNRLKGTPYLLSLRGGDVPGFLEKELGLVHRLTLPLTRQIWARAAALVVNSEGLRQLAARTAPDRAIEVAPNGVDLETFRPRENPKPQDARVRVLFVGRLVKQKWVSGLLEGLAGLDPTVLSRTEVEIVGGGPEEGPLRSLTSNLGLEKVVRFAGWVPRASIAQHYRDADVFVFPSFEEGMPNVVLEAMGCGVPIVATDVRGNREVVRDGVNGLLTPPGDVEALRQALHRVISDADLRQYLGAGSRALAEDYDWSRTADRYLAISQRIVTSRLSHGEGQFQAWASTRGG